MKDLPPGLAGHLAGGVTTLARCWQVVRRDGVTLGFTDHDRDLSFDGITHHAASGLTASAMESQAGLAVSGLEADGALSSTAIAEDDLAAGLYDDASFRLFLANWADVTQRVLLRQGNFGQVTRGRTGFSVELRGLAHRLDQTMGRLYQRCCAWTLGDSHCGIDLAVEGHHGTLVVTEVTDRLTLRVDGIGGLVPGSLDHGRLVWTGGVNAGQVLEIASHRIGGLLALLLPAARPVAVGDTAEVTVGCDRGFDTCARRFGNQLNFGGFPHMPGIDFVLSYPVRGDGNDGSRLR